MPKTIAKENKLVDMLLWDGEDSVLVDVDEDERDWESLIQYINENNEGLEETDEDFMSFKCYYHNKHMCEECLKEERHEGFDLPVGWRWVGYKWENEVFVDNFFSEKAAQAHIDQNRHHYEEPYIFGSSAWRNPEIETLQEILKSLNPVKEKEKEKEKEKV